MEDILMKWEYKSNSIFIDDQDLYFYDRETPIKIELIGFVPGVIKSLSTIINSCDSFYDCKVNFRLFILEIINIEYNFNIKIRKDTQIVKMYNIPYKEMQKISKGINKWLKEHKE